jgi:endonuclease/exonuclease/phosphatase family metal-dependent hydrolase
MPKRVFSDLSLSGLSLLCGLMLFLPPTILAEETKTIRFATFNIAMGLETQTELYKRLHSGEDEALKKVAAIIQQVRPDVLLLNEFDRYELDSTALFIRNYLDTPQFGNQAISYAHAVSGAVNTGVDSGIDLTGNDELGEPGDAWGYGKFPGQYGMAVLSRFPINIERSFRLFKWSDMPDALVPMNPDGSDWYPQETFEKLRLSSKNHWDIKVAIDDGPLHFLVSHPTPPVFDGDEDRNGKRNHDEIRLWADYVDPLKSNYLYDDRGGTGGLGENARFVIAGDLNADPVDGDSSNRAINQLLQHPLINPDCIPISEGAEQASLKQAGKNLQHQGNPASDTGDFNDRYTGNMRIDYVLPSATLKVLACGVFWPLEGQPGSELIDVSDHRLVWLDIQP